jgi:hypothetical protein
VQEDDPATAIAPESQAVQVESSVAPVAAENLPAAQNMQSFNVS